jgi:hypothetical protein
MRKAGRKQSFSPQTWSLSIPSGQQSTGTSIEMGYFDQLAKANASAWTIGFLGEDERPVARYSCQHCHCTTWFELRGNGKVPDPKCCISREPFPREFYDHLTKRPRWAAHPTEAVTVFDGINRAVRKLANFAVFK